MNTRYLHKIFSKKRIAHITTELSLGICYVQKISLRTRYGLCTIYILVCRMIVAGVRADSVQFIFSCVLRKKYYKLCIFMSSKSLDTKKIVDIRKQPREKNIHFKIFYLFAINSFYIYFILCHCSHRLQLFTIPWHVIFFNKK